jgi:hypothetical protein
MLVTLTEIAQTEGFAEGTTGKIAVEPLVIESIRPGELQDYPSKCCAVRIAGEPEPLWIEGDLESITAAIHAAGEDALAKLAAIRAILDE